ncbi:MAG: protein kinase [Planctomycetes bacterium]|nr:protein kinase [Planctomycetota bacterium]
MTLPAEAFNAQAMLAEHNRPALANTARDGGSANQGKEPLLGRAALSERLPGLLPPHPPAGGNGRYEVVGLLGSGASGSVFAARDRDCAREVAVKVLHGSDAGDPGRLGRFVHEAQVTARLEHPGILPVYDIDVTADGQIYFTMRKIDGLSLGDALRQAIDGSPPPALAGLIDRVAIVLRVSEAVAFAHHQGVIHQDIKPDNIMLGAFGEVVLVDWGTASGSGAQHGSRGLVGTPLYMSPEQARRQGADERSDVYCLGATLFHLLYHRPPAWSDDPARFWEKKRNGDIDLPTAAERRSISPRLTDIVLKALASEPGRRYPGARELAVDLRAWQEGRAITARPDTLIDRLRRVYRRNGPVIWTAAAASIALLAVGALLWREKARESTTWTLVASEDFSATPQIIASRWQPWFLPTYDSVQEAGFTASSWSVRDGALQGDGESARIYDLSWKGELGGDLRVEWTLTPVGGQTNLNSYIGGRTRMDGYTFHIGGWNMPTTVTLTRGRNYEVLARRSRNALLQGTTYRMCMEKEGESIRLSIDGEMVIDFHDLEVLSGSEHETFGFETAYTTLRIDDVRISTKPLPLRASPLAVADALFEEGLFARARQRYVEFLHLHPASEGAPIAAYRSARCLAGEGRDLDAISAFESCVREYSGHAIAERALARQAALLLETENEAGAAAVHAELARRQPSEEVRVAVLLGYGEWLLKRFRIDRPDALTDPTLLADLATVRSRFLSLAATFAMPVDEHPALTSCAAQLNRLGLHAQVLAEYPEQRTACANALYGMGRWQDLLSRYSDLQLPLRRCLEEHGRHREILERLSPYDPVALSHFGRIAELNHHPERIHRVHAVLGEGRFDEILRDYPDMRAACANALMMQGRWDDVLDGYADIPWVRTYALAELGRWSELVAGTNDIDIRYAHAFALLRSGDQDAGDAQLAAADALPFPWEETNTAHFGRFIAAPLLRWARGSGPDPVATWRRLRETQRDVLGNLPSKRFAFLLGDLDRDGYLADAGYVIGIELPMLEGVRAELAGDAAQARDAYARYLAMPANRRAPMLAAFAHLRISDLESGQQTR